MHDIMAPTQHTLLPTARRPFTHASVFGIWIPSVRIKSALLLRNRNYNNIFIYHLDGPLDNAPCNSVMTLVSHTPESMTY